MSAQISNHPFPTENAYWHTSLGCIEPYYEDIYTCQDTLMDGVTYRQLYASFYFTSVSGPAIFSGGLRRDGDKVFFKTKPDVKEELVYDFSVEVGDTVRLWRHFIVWGNWTDTLENVLFTVSKIDSILLADGWHKRWRATCNNDFYSFETWIEGVGSTYGPVDRYTCGISGNVAKVYCFWHNGETEYSLFPGTTCDDVFPAECLTTVGFSDPEQEIPSTSVSPNPFSDYLNVSFSYKIPSDVSVQLFDLTGREMILRQQKMGDSFQIERGNLPPGVYFLKIENSTRSGFSKIFKVVAN